MTNTPKFQIGDIVEFRDEVYPQEKPEICVIEAYQEGNDYPYRVRPLNADDNGDFSVACDNELSFVTDPSDVTGKILEEVQTLLEQYKESLGQNGANLFDAGAIAALSSVVAVIKTF